MNFDELILNYCAITNTNKNLIYTYVETVPLKSRESFFFGSVYLISHCYFYVPYYHY